MNDKSIQEDIFVIFVTYTEITDWHRSDKYYFNYFWSVENCLKSLKLLGTCKCTYK